MFAQPYNNSNTGSTNGVYFGRGYLFDRPMADEGRVKLKSLILQFRLLTLAAQKLHTSPFKYSLNYNSIFLTLEFRHTNKTNMWVGNKQSL